jgi:hypothetical protein
MKKISPPKTPERLRRHVQALVAKAEIKGEASSPLFSGDNVAVERRPYGFAAIIDGKGTVVATSFKDIVDEIMSKLNKI